MTEEATVSPVVLRNKGAPIRFARLGADGEPETDADGNVIFEKVWLRINCNAFADMEELYGNAQGLQSALDQKPASTVRQIIGLCLKLEPEEVGDRMDMPAFADYLSAVSMSYLIASGVDPTEVVRIVSKQRELIGAAGKPPMPATGDTPGSNGSESGANLVEVSTSSGV